MLNLTMATDTDTPTPARGGLREGAGRKSAFPGQKRDPPFYMDFTAKGGKALERLRRRTGLSRNDILAHLALTHADRLTFDDDDNDGVIFPGKLGRNGGAVMAIRIPAHAGTKLRAARTRTGKSYSDIGEALVRFYGQQTTFPEVPVSKRATAERAARRRQQRQQRLKRGSRRRASRQSR